MWLIDDSSTVVTNIHVQWRVIGTAGHNALLALGSQFLGCNVP